MLTLAIDTSTEIASVAVTRGLMVLAEDESPSPARHDAVLLPRIQSVLSAAHITLPQLELLAVGLGPGAFGGLRVGLATMKGLGLATGVTLRGVSSLRALACAAPHDGATVLSLIDAHRGELYATLLRSTPAGWQSLLDPFAATPREVAQRVQGLCASAPVIVGSAWTAHAEAMVATWPELRAALTLAEAGPRARHIAALAQDTAAGQVESDLATMVPTYIRGADAKLPAQPLALEGAQEEK